VSRRWKQRPTGSNWGDFGDDDQLGSLNYITPAEIRKAAAEVVEGLRFCLSLPLDYPGGRSLAPHRFPPVLKPTERRGQPFFNYNFKHDGRSFCDVGCDDSVTMCTQYSTQWDSFAHVGHQFDADGDGVAEACYYNGYRAETDIVAPERRSQGASIPLSIDNFAARPIQGRGVMIDLDHHYGREKRTVGLDEIEKVLERDGVAVEAGDIVCFNTGFADELLMMGRAPDPERVHNMCCALDGADAALLDWISERKIAAVAADNYAVERIEHPASTTATKFVPLHYHCLFKRGVPLGELWHLTELARWLRAAGRWSFLLTAPPLRLPGAVGSPVTPVATV
jgi:kynurenine formamidase